jgi:hypothetical protein
MGRRGRTARTGGAGAHPTGSVGGAWTRDVREAHSGSRPNVAHRVQSLGRRSNGVAPPGEPSGRGIGGRDDMRRLWPADLAGTRADTLPDTDDRRWPRGRIGREPLSALGPRQLRTAVRHGVRPRSHRRRRPSIGSDRESSADVAGVDGRPPDGARRSDAATPQRGGAGTHRQKVGWCRFDRILRVERTPVQITGWITPRRTPRRPPLPAWTRPRSWRSSSRP